MDTYRGMRDTKTLTVHITETALTRSRINVTRSSFEADTISFQFSVNCFPTVNESK
jgi:hypothetical protein